MIELDGLESLMRREDGRRFMSELLTFCGVGDYSTSDNLIQNSFVCGRRSVGEALLMMIRAIRSADENQDGLSLLYLMRREEQRRREAEEEEEDGY